MVMQWKILCCELSEHYTRMNTLFKKTPVCRRCRSGPGCPMCPQWTPTWFGDKLAPNSRGQRTSEIANNSICWNCWIGTLVSDICCWYWSRRLACRFHPRARASVPVSFACMYNLRGGIIQVSDEYIAKYLFQHWCIAGISAGSIANVTAEIFVEVFAVLVAEFVEYYCKIWRQVTLLWDICWSRYLYPASERSERRDNVMLDSVCPSFCHQSINRLRRHRCTRRR